MVIQSGEVIQLTAEANILKMSRLGTKLSPPGCFIWLPLWRKADILSRCARTILSLTFDERYRAKEVIDVFGYRMGKGASSVAIVLFQKAGVLMSNYYLTSVQLQTLYSLFLFSADTISFFQRSYTFLQYTLTLSGVNLLG